MNHRLLGPSNPQYQMLSVNGRTYSAGAGQPLDVPDFDSNMLQPNGWVYVAPSGPTSARPTGSLGLYPAFDGAKFFDTTLNKLIQFANGAWRDPATGNAV